MLRPLTIIALFAAATVLAPHAKAWTPAGQVTKVIKVTHWENNEALVFSLAAGVTCYVPATDAKFSTKVGLITTAHVTQRDVSVYCHDFLERVGGSNGIDARRLHRFTIQ